MEVEVYAAEEVLAEAAVAVADVFVLDLGLKVQDLDYLGPGG